MSHEINETNQQAKLGILNKQAGRIGYVVAWMLGVPASVLFFIFLLRGH